MIKLNKQEEKLKEMGVKDPQKFIRYQMLENNINDYSSTISFNFVIGIVLGILTTLMFVYVL
jgi:hypothetical protein